MRLANMVLWIGIMCLAASLALAIFGPSLLGCASPAEYVDEAAEASPNPTPEACDDVILCARYPVPLDELESVWRYDP